MAKIAALVLPAHRAGELPSLLRAMLDALVVGGAPAPATWTAQGRTACVAIAHVGPDALNRTPQPLSADGWTGALAGYVLGDDGDAAPAPGVRRLVQAVAAGGADALPALDGVYAFAAWDGRAERLLAGVDALGMRPLYRVDVPGGGHAVASELKALVALLGDRVAPNWVAWQEQLALGYQLADHTLIEGIDRFAPAQVLASDGTTRSLRTTEHLVESIEESPLPRAEFLEENHAAFLRAMRRCDALRDPAVAPLLTVSGGLDSRRFLGWMVAQGLTPELYTVPLPRPDGTEIESGIVRELARRLGLGVRQVAAPTGAALDRVRIARDLAADFETDEHAVYATTALALRRPDAVNFDGLSGDTLLNPGWFLRHEYLEPGGDDRFLAELVPDVSWVRLPADVPPLAERVRAVWAGYRGQRSRYTRWALETRGRRELALGPMLLQANAFETVYPYLERDFVRQSLRLPPAERIGTLLQRPLIRMLGVPALDETPSTRDLDAAAIARFRRSVPDARVAADGRLLRRVARRGRAHGAGLGASARLRLAAAAALWHAPGLALRSERLQWEASKAAQVDRLLRHLDAVAGGAASYAAAMEPLRGAWGRESAWVTELATG